jgi:hypothetical protein
LKPQDNRDTGALCFSKNTLDLLSQFTCLKNIDEAIREVTTNRKHPLFKKVCSAVSVHLIGKNNALGKMKLHREVRRLAIIGDLLDEKSWKLKLITRMYLFEKNIKNTCDTNRNINISDCFWKRHPVLKDSADKKIERLYNRFEKTKEIFQKYPMLDFVMPEPMLQNHSEFSKLSSVVRDYVKMADQQHTVPSTQSPKLRIVK